MPSVFQQWYAKNADRLNARRRRRYKKDVDYRQNILDTNKAFREQKRETRQKELIKRVRAVRMMPTESAWKTVDVEVNGVVTPMYTIGALARAIQRGISTVRVWEKEGVLPATPHRSPKGDRLYTVGAVEEIRKLLKRDGRIEQTPKLSTKRPPDVVVKKVRMTDGAVRKVELYKVGALARAVGRTVVSIEQMEKVGRLPKTTLRASSLAYRLYSMKMIESVKEAFDRNGGRLRGNDWPEFCDTVTKAWKDQKMLGATVEV